MPKNILMIGPTGVGKTEIARRLARLAGFAVPQGRGLEVHRGGLRRPRRRVDGPRSGGDRRSRWCARKSASRCGTQAALAAQQADPRPAAAATASGPRVPPTTEPRPSREREEQESWERSRETLAQPARGGRARGARGAVRDHRNPAFCRHAHLRSSSGHGRAGHEPEARCCPTCSRANRSAAQDDGGRGAGRPQREEEDKLIDPEQVVPRGLIRRVEQSGILFIDELDKIAGPRGRPRPGSLA